jgi:hypothetical protein
VPRRDLHALKAPLSGLPNLEYPLHGRDVLATACGRICIYRKKINISTVLVSAPV